MLYNNFNTSTKTKKLTDVSNTFISEITKKVQGEPSWLKDISNNLIKESEAASQSGNERRIAETNKRLESFNIDLDGFNEMPSDRKAKSHIVDFTKERYKPLKVEEPKITNISLPKTNGNLERSSLEDRLKRNIPSMDKYGRFKSGFSNLPQNIEPGEKPHSYQTMVHKHDGDNADSFTDSQITKLGMKDTVADVANAVKGGARWVKDTAKILVKKEANINKISKDPGCVDSYETGEEDYSKTYGVTFLRDVNDDLGTDDMNSRKRATNIISPYKDTINEMGNAYGVDPVVIGGCIFAEQACNIIPFENVVDEGKYVINNNASFGIGQVMVSTAVSLEKDKKIKNPIKFVRIDKADQVWWDVPGVGLLKGTLEDAVKARLKVPEENIEYVAAYLSSHQEAWKENADVDLSAKPDVLATLYNIGHNEEKGYHANPQSNDFGKYVRANYGYISKVLSS